MHNIKVVKLAAYFKNNYQYVSLNVDNRMDELWLMNQNSEKINLIRISDKNLGSVYFDEDRINKVIELMQPKYKFKIDFLDIHVGTEKVEDESYKTIMIDNKYYNGYDINEVLVDFKKDVLVNVKAIKVPKHVMMHKRKPIVTYAIIAICTIIFLAINFLSTLPLYYGSTAHVELWALLFGAYYKDAVVYLNEYYRLVTHAFVHIDFIHLAFNMYALYNLGRIFEMKLGSIKYLLVLLTSILMGGFVVFFMQGNIITVGISGGLYGLLGLYIADIYMSGLINVPHIKRGVINIVMMCVIVSLMPGVSLEGHIGGFVGGLLCSIILFSKEKKSMFVINTKIALAGILLFCSFNLINYQPKYESTNLNNLIVLGALAEQIGLDSYANSIFIKLNQ